MEAISGSGIAALSCSVSSSVQGQQCMPNRGSYRFLSPFHALSVCIYMLEREYR